MTWTFKPHLRHTKSKLCMDVLHQQLKKSTCFIYVRSVQVVSLMIKHEERMFDESFGVAMGLKKPEIPLMEDFQDPKEYEKPTRSS